MPNSVNGANAKRLWERADAIIPRGGIYLTRSARFAGNDVLPGFIQSAEGCHVIDVDGRKYVDFNCGNGPNLLGYRHPEVDAAALRQSQKMDLASFYPETMVTYAERLLEWSETFDWTILAKNGSDVTNLAIRIMRSARQRPLIVLFKSAYHGFGAEISLNPESEADAANRNIIRIPWNDAEALRDLITSRGDQVAGLMINPLDQNTAQETQQISKDLVMAIEEFRERTGAYVTVDDVRNGFRLHEKGSHRHMGIEPDIVCLGKALANGYAMSAIVAKENLRSAAEQIQLTATYMFSSVAFCAGIATLDVYERDGVLNHLQKMGQRLVAGLTKAGKAAGHDDVLLSGPVTMPTFLFKNDSKAKRARMFAQQAAMNGAIFHPTLNWFLSFAHQERDIDDAIEIATAAFKKTPLTLE